MTISVNKAAIMTKIMFDNYRQWFMVVLKTRGSGTVILILLIFLGFPATWVFGADSDQSAMGISVNAENETLTNVLKKISQISGYEIEFEQEWGNYPVNVQFENEPLEDALSRVLANLNHALIWNDTEKKISVFINGEVSSKRSKSPSSVSGSSSVSRGSEVRKRIPRPGGDEGDLPVSVSGQKTRFGQGTRTID